MIFNREVNDAILAGKLACSHRNCLGKNAFYQKNGILHHYKTMHGPNVPSSLLEEARARSCKLHGDETKAYLEHIYHNHAMEVGIREIINVVSDCYEFVESILTNLHLFQHRDDPSFLEISATYQPLNLQLKIKAKTPTEPAKLMGFCLLHYGVLQPFTSGRKSGRKITISNSEFLFEFLVWKKNGTDHLCNETSIEQEITSVIVTAIHSKRVRNCTYHFLVTFVLCLH